MPPCSAAIMGLKNPDKLETVWLDTTRSVMAFLGGLSKLTATFLGTRVKAVSEADSSSLELVASVELE